MARFIIEMPHKWDWADPCKDCPFECDSCTFPALNCPLGHAKEAIEVKFEYDPESGLSVIDENNIFHFEGQDKYYAVKVDK